MDMDNAKLGRTLMRIPRQAVQALWQVMPYEFKPEELHAWYLLLRYIYQEPLSPSDLNALRAYMSSEHASYPAHPHEQRIAEPQRYLGPQLPALNGHDSKSAAFSGPLPKLCQSSMPMMQPMPLTNAHTEPVRDGDAPQLDSKRPYWDAPPAFQQAPMQSTSADLFQNIKPTSSHNFYHWSADPLYAPDEHAEELLGMPH